MSFSTQLNQQILAKNSRICVGLDPRLNWLPSKITKQAIKDHGQCFEAAAAAILDFNQQVIDIVAPLVAAIKPQIAFYELYGPPGLKAFEQTVAYAHQRNLLVIGDVKRSDIASTAAAYAQAMLDQTDLFGQPKPVFNLDCITINPFLGQDSLEPFTKVAQTQKKGLFILVKTSNPGSADFQDLIVEGKTITTRLANLVNQLAQAEKQNKQYSNIGAVVGATFPQQAAGLRQLMPNSIFLVPGVGAQGGSEAELRVFFNSDKLGALVNSSRGIIFSKKGREGPGYLKLIKDNTIKLRDQVNQAVGA
ncbi:MAG: orotidine-5'-phosphate decarboxylase [Candidatus Pacebacteria bacterium]|nr:orotidine-5'-phosphate decarboxylase [Candidatus Paceibacterota bacterium]